MRSRSLPSLLALLTASAVAASCAGEEDVDDQMDQAEEAAVDTTAAAAPGVRADEETSPTDLDMEYREELTAQLSAPEGGDPAVTGTVRVLVPVRELEATPARHLAIDVEGLSPGAHAWHIHDGPCGTEAPVIIPLSGTADAEATAGPLVVADDGTASTEVPVDDLENLMLGEGNYSLHVHEKAGVEHGPTVACATL